MFLQNLLKLMPLLLMKLSLCLIMVELSHTINLSYFPKTCIMNGSHMQLLEFSNILILNKQTCLLSISPSNLLTILNKPRELSSQRTFKAQKLTLRVTSLLKSQQETWDIKSTLFKRPPKIVLTSSYLLSDKLHLTLFVLIMTSVAYMILDLLLMES
jgi:hypothetical protein